MENQGIRPNTIIFLSFLFLISGILLSIFIGTSLTFDPQIFWILRLPRTLCALAVGGGLAIAGTLIQASFGNPLADPYTIGIASAAALGAVIGSIFQSANLISSSVFAFGFAMGALVILVTWLKQSFRHATEILLVGVIAGFFFSSTAALIMALEDPAAWSSAMGWLMGRLQSLSLVESIVITGIMLLALGTAWVHWKPLDLIAVDELSAESAGVDVTSFRKRFFILAALIIAICVSAAGIIGFLGLIVPHALRKLGLRSHIVLIPASFLAGAGMLLCSDTLARLVARPSEIPVGVVMAMLGAPLFLILVRNQKEI